MSTFAHAAKAIPGTTKAPASPAPGLADLGQLADDERATILAIIDAMTTKARLCLITGGAS